MRVLRPSAADIGRSSLSIKAFCAASGKTGRETMNSLHPVSGEGLGQYFAVNDWILTCGGAARAGRTRAAASRAGRCLFMAGVFRLEKVVAGAGILIQADGKRQSESRRYGFSTRGRLPSRAGFRV